MRALSRFGVALAASLVLLAMIVPALAGGEQSARDEFNAISYEGSDGLIAWSGPWRETPLTDGPSEGAIRVVANESCVAGYCMRIGPQDLTGRGVYRTVDLTGATAATLSFAVHRNVATGSDARVDVAVSTDGWSWDVVAEIDVDRADLESWEVEQDLTAWAGSEIRVGFFGAGEFAGFVYLDDVTVSADTSQTPVRTEDFSNAPSIDPIDDQEVAELQQLRVTATATDPDLPNDVLRFSLVEGPSGAAISPGGTVTWTPGEIDGPGSHVITVRVEDASGGSAQDSFRVTVTEVNTAPRIGTIPDQAVAPGDTMTVEVAVDDPDVPANRLAFSATGLPVGVTIDEATGVISGTVPASAAATSGIATVTVTDDGSPAATDTQTLSWQITLGNRAPVLSPIPEATIGTDGVVTFTASASDADGDDDLEFWLTEGIDPVPAGAVIGKTSGVFTWTPSEDRYGARYRFNVGVSDSGSPRLSDTELVTIVLPEYNHPPTVDEIGDLSTAEGEAVRFPVNAADPDGNEIEFAATGLPSGIGINPVTGFITGEADFTAGSGSPYRVTVTVTDNGSPAAATSVNFVWEVTETNQPPIVEPISVNALVATPTSIVLEATDPDGDELQYEVVTDPSFGTLTGEPPNLTYTGSTAGRDEFTIAVSDGEATVEALVTIDIRTSNAPPTANVDEYNVEVDGRLDEGAPGVLGNDTDPDGEPIIAVLIAPPDHGDLVLNEDGSFVYTPEAGYAGQDKFVYAAVDGMGEQATATVVLNITSADQPGSVTMPPGTGSRMTVLSATTPTWQEPDVNGGALPRLRRAFVSAIHSGIASLPGLGAPLLLLAAALVLALTVGRVSLLPAGAGKTQGEGTVIEYDRARGFGRVEPDDGGEPIYIHSSAIEEGIALATGRRVEFIVADIKGRRVALNVWST